MPPIPSRRIRRPGSRPQPSPRAEGSHRDTDASVPWSPRRLIEESDVVARRLQQLQARPWWRVSARELDELDDRVTALRAHARGRG